MLLNKTSEPISERPEVGDYALLRIHDRAQWVRIVGFNTEKIKWIGESVHGPKFGRRVSFGRNHIFAVK